MYMGFLEAGSDAVAELMQRPPDGLPYRYNRRDATAPNVT